MAIPVTSLPSLHRLSSFIWQMEDSPIRGSEVESKRKSSLVASINSFTWTLVYTLKCTRIFLPFSVNSVFALGWVISGWGFCWNWSSYRWLLNIYIKGTVYCNKRLLIFPSPAAQPGYHLPNSPCLTGRNNLIIPVQGKYIVCDISAGDRKILNLFFTV